MRVITNPSRAERISLPFGADRYFLQIIEPLPEDQEDRFLVARTIKKNY